MSVMIRTDLAVEAREWQGAQDMPGVRSETIHDDADITISRVQVLNEAGAQSLGKPIGRYISIDVPKLRQRDPLLEERISHCIAQETKVMMPELKDKDTVLVVGLGNQEITPDALGPRVVSKMMVTRHILEMVPEQVDERVRSVCAIAPGVLGITGIETAEIIKGAVEHVKPAVVIAIDALAARYTSRLGTVVQITDTGINPGSGLGNRRATINREALGIPVIALGIPVVVYASTIARDVISMVDNKYDEESAERAVKSVLNQSFGDLMVTPKDVDVMIEDSARVLSMGLNLLIHKGVTINEVNRFLH